MSEQPKELFLDEFRAAARHLSPEEVAALIVRHRDHLPPAGSIVSTLSELPPEKFNSIVAAMAAQLPPDLLSHFVEELTEDGRRKGRVIGAELVNKVLKGEISPHEASHALASLPPIQYAEARDILSIVSEVNKALGRIASGEATIELELKPDEEGYFDRVCPSAECGQRFKVFHEDIKGKKLSHQICPFCRHHGWHQDFDTPTQREHVRYRGMRLVEEEVTRALPGFAHEVRPIDYETPQDVRVKIEQVMEQKFRCEKCACGYASIGNSFFCPACGHNNVIATFDSVIATVRSALNSVSALRLTLTERVGEGIAENLIRMTYENSFVKLVSSFQRYAEALFDGLPNRERFEPRRNVFQNLSESSVFWRQATGFGYEDVLAPAELVELERHFQQRHLLAHKEGIVDQQYISKSGDSRFAIGQRLVIHDAAVRSLADLISKLALELKKHV